jgi:hypothetical protein
VKFLGWLGFAAFSVSAFAQHPNGSHSVPGPPAPASRQPILSSGLPPVAPIPPLGNSTPSTQNLSGRRHFGPAGRGFGYGGYPFLWGDSGDVYAPQPEMQFAEPPPPARYVIVQASPPPVRPEIHEYGSTNPADAEPSGQEPPTFAIALESGSTRSAVAVAVQGDALVYVDEDGAQQRIALDAVNRDATRRLNRAKGLDLRLPPANR